MLTLTRSALKLGVSAGISEVLLTVVLREDMSTWHLKCHIV